MPFDLHGKRIFVAGHGGMVGSAIVRRLGAESCDILSASRDRLDLGDQAAVRAWMARERPDIVVLAAARVGGILANDTMPAEFIHENLVIAANVIHAAHLADVDRLLFLGSSCIYPKFTEQPIKEQALLTGALEPTNQWYAVAKSPASSWPRPIGGNMGATIFRRCRPTCTGRATISTSARAMFYLH